MFSHFTFVMTLNCRLVLSYYCCSTCFDKTITVEMKNKNQINTSGQCSYQSGAKAEVCYQFFCALFSVGSLPVSLLCFAFENAFLFDECSRDRPTFSNWWKEKGRRFRCDDFHFWTAAETAVLLSVWRGEYSVAVQTDWLAEDNFNCTVVNRQSNLGLRYDGTLLCNNCAAT